MWFGILAVWMALHPTPAPVGQCFSNAQEFQAWQDNCADLDGNPVQDSDGSWSCLDEEGNVYVND